MKEKFRLLFSSLFLKHLSIIFSFDIMAKILTMVILLILVRTLSKDDYAIFVKFNSLANLLFGILTSGVGIAFVRSVSDLSSQGKADIIPKLYGLALFAVVILILPVFFFSSLLANAYKIAKSYIILSLIYTVVISFFKICQFYYQGQEKYSMGGIVDIVRTGGILLPLLFLICVLKKDLSALSVSCIYIVSGILIFGCFFLSNNIKAVFPFTSVTLSCAKDLLKESAWLLLYCGILALFSQIDILLLSRFASNEEIANYGVAQKYQALMLSVLPSLLALMRVKTAKQEYTKNPQLRRDFAIKWIKITAPATVVILAIGGFLSKYILPVLNGEKYNDAILLFQIMLIGIGISYVFSPNVPVLMAAKRFPTLCILCMISLLISFCGNYLLIPIWGAIAPSVFFVIAHSFLNVGATYFILSDARRCANA